MTDTNIMLSIVEIAKLLAPLGGAWLGASLTRRTSLETARAVATIDREKHKHNSLWDARRDAYTQIASALTTLGKSTSLIDDHMNGEEAETERYYESDLFSIHSQAMWHEFRAVKSIYENQILVLSEAFKVQFNEWQKDFLSDDYGTLPQQAMAQDRAMTVHIPRFIALARAEIWPDL